MIVYGYAKEYYYTGDGTLMVKVRVPNIHGPFRQTDNKSKRKYVRDVDLPWYPGLLMPHLPHDGDVVCLQSINNSMNDMIVIGLTGGSYLKGVTDLD